MAQFFRYPAGATVSITAIGTNGATAPTTSMEVAGINPSGNLQPLQTDASGNLLTVDSAPTVPKHVIVDSSALPTGAATAAAQATGNASLSSIDSKLTAPLSVTGPLTDAQLRASAVPVSAASLPLPSGAATSALQTTGNSSLSSIDTKTPALGQALAASSVPVVLTAAQLTTLTPLTSVTVTQATGTNLHTTVDNFPATQPVSGTVAATQSGTWNITNVSGTVSLPTGASTAANQATEIASLSSIDGKLADNFGAASGALRVAAIPGNASGIADFGAGAAGAQTPRVVLATGGAAPSAASGRAFANAPTLNDYTGSPVTSAAYVQLIASTTSATNMVEIFDSSGVTLYFAVGAAASEVNQFIITPGGNGQVPLAIPAGSRVSIKATSTSATVGFIAVNLYT